AEVEFSNIMTVIVNDPVTGLPNPLLSQVATANAYRSLLTTRYVSGRVTPLGPASVPDTLSIDPTSGGILKTGLPFASPGLPYFRDFLSVIKHNGVPNDFAGLNITPGAYTA